MAWCWQTPRAFSWVKIYAIIWRHLATISQYIASQFFMHLSIVMSPIIAKLCFASSFIPDLEANFMVTEFTTRDIKYYWWSLFSQTFKWLWLVS